VSPDAANPAFGNVAMLTWQTPTGQWATLRCVFVDKLPDWQTAMTRAAAAVTVGDRDIAMPFHISGLPSDFKDLAALLLHPPAGPDRGWQAEAAYRVGTSTVSIDATPLGQRTPAGSLLPSAGSVPNADSITVQGSNTNPVADLKATPGKGTPSSFACAEANGLHICVTVIGDEPSSLKAIGGPDGLLDTITSLGTDPAKWTTRVVG
jgi:hypothetical protein